MVLVERILIAELPKINTLSGFVGCTAIASTAPGFTLKSSGTLQHKSLY